MYAQNDGFARWFAKGNSLKHGNSWYLCKISGVCMDEAGTSFPHEASQCACAKWAAMRGLSPSNAGRQEVRKGWDTPIKSEYLQEIYLFIIIQHGCFTKLRALGSGTRCIASVDAQNCILELNHEYGQVVKLDPINNRFNPFTLSFPELPVRWSNIIWCP